MEIFQLLTLLLSPAIVGGEYPELSLISELSEQFRFDHHFYLLASSADTNRYIDTKRSTPQSLYVSRSEDNVSDGLDNVAVVNSKNAFMIVVPESVQFDENSTLLRWMKNVPRRQMTHMKIGVFYSQYSHADLHRLFQWCKENSIVNIFAATCPCCSEVVPSSCPKGSINIFTFNPFGEFDVINVTGSDMKWDDVFVSRKSNFQQHQLRFGRHPWNSIDVNIWSNVLRLMNATEAVIKHNYTDAREAVMNGIDIFPELMIQTDVDDFKVYPVIFVDKVIIVPEALPYAEFTALLRNATSGELCGYSFVSIVAAILVLSILRHINRKKVTILQSVTDVCNLLMNDNGHVRYQQLCRSEMFIVVPLTFVGLIVTNGILSLLQSHLTRPLLQPQINSAEDLYASPFPVLVHEAGYNEGYRKDEVIDVLLNRTDKGKDWSRKVISDVNYFDNLLSFNQTASFILPSDLKELIMRVQKRMQTKVFHNPNIRISQEFYGYAVSDKFLYFERFDDKVQRMKSAGLFDLWMRQWFSSLESRIIGEYKKRRMDHGGETSPVENFEFPMLIVYGWLVGLIVFILEIIWNFVTRWRKIRRTWAE